MKIDIERAIRQRDVPAIMRMFFPREEPVLDLGLRTENELWDYKIDCPRSGGADKNPWAQISKDILAFHNRRGGLLFFGIDDESFEFRGATSRLDSKLVNDQVRRYLGDKIWVEYSREFIQPDQRYLGLLLIPPRGPTMARFHANSPKIGGRHSFKAQESALRVGDTSQHLSAVEIELAQRKSTAPNAGQVYVVDEPFCRILAPEYSKFVERVEACAAVERALVDPRTSTASITGIGGMGKTALATWATMRAHQRGDFELIVSITAKDRELSGNGISAINPCLTSYGSLLDAILDVSGCGDIRHEGIEDQERKVRELLEGCKALLVVDNLETVDDARIIDFLDELPPGVRALTTSRRGAVRVSVRPIDLGPMSDAEMLHLIELHSEKQGFSYLVEAREDEARLIGESCNGIPLAIQWILSRVRSMEEALQRAEGLERRSDEELLEFMFRRVFDSMASVEQEVLQVLSLFENPLPSEVVAIGGKIPQNSCTDALDDLIRDSLVHKVFDADLNDYTYALLPVTRAFAYSEVLKSNHKESRIRRQLRDYFDAADVSDPGQRVAIRSLRQGGGNASRRLLDLARSAERRGVLDDAESLYKQALERDGRSWEAARAYAEFCRHKRNSVRDALAHYERAAAHAPREGRERAMIFREWGILLRSSGLEDASAQAIEKLEVALEALPSDPNTRTALAQLVSKKGQWVRVIELVGSLVDSSSGKTLQKVIPLLERAYDETREILKLAEVREAARKAGISVSTGS